VRDPAAGRKVDAAPVRDGVGLARGALRDLVHVEGAGAGLCASGIEGGAQGLEVLGCVAPDGVLARPRDGEPGGVFLAGVAAPRAPGETRRLGYRVRVGSAAHVTVAVWLLFGSLAPHMVHALGSGQAAGEAPLAPLVDNLQVVEMAAKTITVEAGADS
jgi:hypothetical protein